MTAQPRTQAATENQHYIMQNYCKTIGALAAASALVAGNAKAGVEYELHTGYSSEYLYRGVNLGQDLIEVGADVKMDVNNMFNLSAGAWYGTVTNNIGFPGSVTMSELDLYVEASKDFGPVTGKVGYIFRQYDLDFAKPTSGEIYFGVSHDFGIVEASLTYYWGVSEVDVFGITPGVTDGYTEFALRHSFVITPCLNVAVSSNIGYLCDDRTWTAWTSKVALDWAFAEHAKLSPFIMASVAIGEQNNTIWTSTTNQLVGGCMLSVNF